MKLRVNVTPDAELQIEDLKEWWDTNRTAAKPLTDELERVLALLCARPHLGLRLQKSPILGVRTYRVGSTPYFLYYLADTKRGLLHILAAWSGAKPDRPPLYRP